jgi:aerotaxis receptor
MSETKSSGLIFQDDGEVLYDDLYLLSETDEKGIITYVSESFAEIAGYSVEEMLGQPHNVVRHPDMPRAAFKDLWDNASKKGFWTGYVKNLRKDGRYYWVFATVLKRLDEKGNINYVSIRIKPSREEVEKAEKLYQTMK